jgi:hypothetical protein
MNVKKTVMAALLVTDQVPHPHARARRHPRPISGEILKFRELFSPSPSGVALLKTRK